MQNNYISKYDPIWDSPSKDHNGSMPIGNGETGANFWVENNGNLHIIISRTDSWDELNRLCKVGWVTINILPDIDSNTKFKQRLNLFDGIAEITYENKISNVSRTIKLWIDVNSQVIRIEINSNSEFTVKANLEIWRTKKRLIQGGEGHFVGEHKDENYSYPDNIINDSIIKNGLVWYHQNPTSAYPLTLKNQYLDDFEKQSVDPLLNNIFGACVIGENLKRNEDELISETQQKKYEINIYTLTIPNSNPEAWEKRLLETVLKYQENDYDQKEKIHKKWWNDYWNRSWIIIESDTDKNAFDITQCYLLQKWVQTSAGRGNYPIKFNGTIFTVNTKYDPDYRQWGGPYWFQNTRLVYWPMLSEGDWEMMKPLFKMYQGIRNLAIFRNKKYFNHRGWFFPETMTSWGTYVNENYGWTEKEHSHIGPGDPINNQYIRYHFNGSLELLALMIEYFEFTNDENFFKNELIPIAEDFLDWWLEHWKLDTNQKMNMYPSQSLETYWDIKNPTPDIAGLKWNLSYFLDDKIRTKIGKLLEKRWKELDRIIPDIPIGSIKWRKSKKIILPTETMKKRTNFENPELYTVFPFRLFTHSSSKSDLDMARLTFKKRTTKGGFGWSQDDTQAAFLGLTKDAKDILTERVKKKNKGSRFPVFWGPNYDWIPDQDHGSNLLMALQFMLLQWDKDSIYLFPSWPKEWNVKFKLWAPNQTNIQGELINGVLKKLIVNPKERATNVKILNNMKSMDE